MSWRFRQAATQPPAPKPVSWWAFFRGSPGAMQLEGLAGDRPSNCAPTMRAGGFAASHISVPQGPAPTAARLQNLYTYPGCRRGLHNTRSVLGGLHAAHGAFLVSFRRQRRRISRRRGEVSGLHAAHGGISHIIQAAAPTRQAASPERRRRESELPAPPDQQT